VKKYFILLVFVLALNISGYCGQRSRIELTDGSVLNGEVVSLANGTYTINSASMGAIKINAAKVVKIEVLKDPLLNTPVYSSAQLKDITPEQIDSYKQKIMSNPDNAAVINDLTANPQIQELAKDPTIVNAAKSGDVQTLISNKKFKDLLESPELEETAKKIKQ